MMIHDFSFYIGVYIAYLGKDATHPFETKYFKCKKQPGLAALRQLTEALGSLAAPVAAALARKHGGKGQLVALVARVADA